MCPFPQGKDAAKKLNKFAPEKKAKKERKFQKCATSIMENLSRDTLGSFFFWNESKCQWRIAQEVFFSGSNINATMDGRWIDGPMECCQSSKWKLQTGNQSYTVQQCLDMDSTNSPARLPRLHNFLKSADCTESLPKWHAITFVVD